MKLLNSTKKWSAWWGKRVIDWGVHYMNPDHPHRVLLAQVVCSLPFISLVEFGCGAGANLVQILKAAKNKQVGGIDINKDAIALAEKTFTGGMFKVGSADDALLSDKSTDIVLTDMYMIYVSPFQIKKQLREIKRVARAYVVMCEFHSESFWERLALNWREGYYMYNYKKLLEKHGFYDINMYKLPKDFWPESDIQQKYCHIIVARTPRDYQ